MNTSQQGLRALMKSEAFRADAYQDSVGKWTIGYGTIKLDGKPVQKGQRITQERAAGALAEFCTGMEAALNTALLGADTKQHEFDAFINLGYNIGTAGMIGSSALRLHVEGNKRAAADAFLLWNKGTINGIKQTIVGLSNRRTRERAMYLNGVYVM
ncbi:hypothetical protein Arno18_63 [Pectobacterium phage Arno18]|uniref:Endolysin n=1 Tax=Pectobacterium phage Arno18 TaxID=2500578 RepID=A0A678ZN30_9CAUD|nr:hypothetical protein Arno18_63 [Pectobacterium phage Arno18]